MIHRMLRKRRLKFTRDIIMDHLKEGSVLDIGCMDLKLKKLLKGFEYTGIDPNPKQEGIIDIDINKFNTRKKYDVVIATEVLEHLEYPLKAIRKIKSLSNKYILISVPNEPTFTFFRLGIIDKEHLYDIKKNILTDTLGQPIFEDYCNFGRIYIGLWDVTK